MVSTNCTISCAEAVLVSRNDFCERFWNHLVRIASGTSAPKSTSPLTQSSENIAMAMNSM